ncbi:MAG TPA: adenosine deaminase [Alphaproteobacteria bacterium]|nr:adenosine deaminase [Alphaproteobacteria bacterium]
MLNRRGQLDRPQSFVFCQRFSQRTFLGLILLVLVSGPAWAQKAASPEERTARYFDSVRQQPSLLMDFLHRMPKGADLHNHLSGSIYAETFVKWAVQDGLCIDKATLSFVAPPCDAASGKPPASVAYQDQVLYGHLLDAFSMRQFVPGAESGHDHFFASFGKFGLATNGHTAEMLAEVRSRSAAEHLQYLELMFTPDGGDAARLGAQVGWNDDLAKMREQILAAGLPQIVAKTSKSLDEIEAKENEEMRCGKPQADPGCTVQARYLYQVLRGIPKQMVFAQILLGFEMASHDPRVVGLNLVMAEDWYVPIRDFNLHMQMLDFLHKLYPNVHISLHAGELTPQLVPPEELFHIRASVELGHAERIGHGVDAMREPDPAGLLREMARKNVLVEICLTSNDVILNVTGTRHPLPMYLKFGVPVALATDDAGVSRGSITQEYQRAAETYGLRYLDLKKMARASVTHSFLPGESLWKDQRPGHGGTTCAMTLAMDSVRPPSACSRLLETSEKARAEAALEMAFAEFERTFR